jgi:hypothetical protein
VHLRAVAHDARGDVADEAAEEGVIAQVAELRGDLPGFAEVDEQEDTDLLPGPVVAAEDQPREDPRPQEPVDLGNEVEQQGGGEARADGDDELPVDQVRVGQTGDREERQADRDDDDREPHEAP